MLNVLFSFSWLSSHINHHIDILWWGRYTFYLSCNIQWYQISRFRLWKVPTKELMHDPIIFLRHIPDYWQRSPEIYLLFVSFCIFNSKTIFIHTSRVCSRAEIWKGGWSSYAQALQYSLCYPYVIETNILTLLTIRSCNITNNWLTASREQPISKIEEHRITPDPLSWN